MDLKQLKALVTVAEVGSVTRAAELLHLVQPAVTRQIRAMETELGVTLFERTRNGMQLTEAGAIMAERARRALRELARATAEIQPQRGEVAGQVTVGLLESTIDTLAEPLVTAVKANHPHIELRMLTGYSGHLQRWLDDGDLDVTLLYNLTDTPSVNVAPLLSEQLWAVAPPEAGLRADEPITLAEVAEQSLVMPAPGHALRALIDTAAARNDILFDVSVQTNSLALQKQFVLGGHGWTILPGAGIVADVSAGLLSAAPLCEPEIRRVVVLGMPRTGRLPAAAEVVAQELVRQVRTAVQAGRWPSARWKDHAATDR
ncbi:LysR family transcriptional regulator [Nocardia sp. BMG111209]|uniref:LysR family transcriptional regulator n=1 Tax=Nocardia sp. BMG111209 TaxID=1160137 RepID=UPI00036F2186|nr:LysR family transcriptional regulator [Nocardia sp. BMG111209]